MTVFQDAAMLAESNAGFRQQVLLAMVTAAVAIANEPVETPLHAARAVLATQVVAEPYRFLTSFALSVASNPAITAASNDGDVQFTVNSIWNAHALVFYVAPVEAPVP